MIKAYNFDDFASVTKDDWQEKLFKDLPRQVAQRIQSWQSDRSNSFEAYYCAKDGAASSNILQFASQFRSTDQDWQYISHINVGNKSTALSALMNGAGGLMLSNELLSDLDETLQTIDPAHCTIGIRTDKLDEIQLLLKWRDQMAKSPLSYSTLVFSDIDSFQKENISSQKYFYSKIITSSINREQLKWININNDLVQSKGGSIQTELVYMLSRSVHVISDALDQGMTIDDIAKSIFVSTAIGSGYFVELVKIDLIRALLGQLLSQYGAKVQPIYVHARTSSLTKSGLDENTNLLRCTTEAMSAVIGGVDALSIDPHHSISFSARIARNMSNLLKEEAYLGKVAQPADGAYYLETMASQLAKASWTSFQTLESKGGFEWAMKNNYFQDEIDQDFKFLTDQFESGKKNLVGVSNFGNLDEKLSIELPSIDHASNGGQFESVRKWVEKYVDQYGEIARPTVQLVSIGDDNKMINARAGFITNFFGWAGFKVLPISTLITTGALNVLCGADEDYETIEEKWLSENTNFATLIVAAGKPNSEVPISTWIHARSNRLSSVVDLLNKLHIIQNPS